MGMMTFMAGDKTPTKTEPEEKPKEEEKPKDGKK